MTGDNPENGKGGHTMYTEDRNLHYFREISRIPRKSFHEKAVVDYI